MSINNKIFAGYSSYQEKQIRKSKEMFNSLLQNKLSISLKPTVTENLNVNEVPEYRQFFIIKFGNTLSFVSKHHMVIENGIITKAELTFGISDAYLYTEEDLPYLRKLCDETFSTILAVTVFVEATSPVYKGLS